MRVAALLAVIGALATSACAQQADLHIVLQPMPGATLEGLDAIRVNVRELSRSAPEVFDAYAFRTDTEKTLRTSVDTGEPFYVDVWGCETAEACFADDVIARGCTQVLVLEELEPGEEQPPVGVYIDDLPVDACPPPIPADLQQ